MGRLKMADNHSKLGREIVYPDCYSAELLDLIPRQTAREKFIVGGDALPFHGVDIWTAYELSWLEPSGKPCVALAEFFIPAHSSNIIESKSFKYYLNSFNQTTFVSQAIVENVLAKDISAAVEAEVLVKLYNLRENFASVSDFPGKCIDDLPINVSSYNPDSSLLAVDATERVCEENLYTHLLKSNCPVTRQPDWASLWLRYSGSKILPEALLKYIVSYRCHQDFHENCVERIFMDIINQCGPEKLTVYARYTRRGGLDINPFRTNCGDQPPIVRLIRQ